MSIRMEVRLLLKEQNKNEKTDGWCEISQNTYFIFTAQKVQTFITVQGQQTREQTSGKKGFLEKYEKKIVRKLRRE